MQNYSKKARKGKKNVKNAKEVIFFSHSCCGYDYYFLSLPYMKTWKSSASVLRSLFQTSGLGCTKTNIIYHTPTIMPNRKDLKKSINSICSDVFAECVAMSLYHGNTDEANVDALLSSILAIRADFISRISHPEPGMKKKDYYDHLAKAFTEQISEVIDQICNMSE